DCKPDELGWPHRECISIGASTPEIAENPNPHERVKGDITDAVFALRLDQAFGVIGTLNYRHEAAIPYVFILIRSLGQILAPRLVQRRGKPRVVPPVHLHDLRAVRRVLTKPLVRRALLALWVPRDPDFCAFLAHGRNGYQPPGFADLLGFIDPQQQDPRLGLDAFQVMTQAGELELDPTVAGADVLLPDVVGAGQHRLTRNCRL